MDVEARLANGGDYTALIRRCAFMKGIAPDGVMIHSLPAPVLACAVGGRQRFGVIVSAELSKTLKLAAIVLSTHRFLALGGRSASPPFVLAAWPRPGDRVATQLSQAMRELSSLYSELDMNELDRVMEEQQEKDWARVAAISHRRKRHELSLLAQRPRLLRS